MYIASVCILIMLNKINVLSLVYYIRQIHSSLHTWHVYTCSGIKVNTIKSLLLWTVQRLQSNYPLLIFLVVLWSKVFGMHFNTVLSWYSLSFSPHRFELQGLEGYGELGISVSTQNRTKCYQLVAQFKNVDLRWAVTRPRLFFRMVIFNDHVHTIILLIQDLS